MANEKMTLARGLRYKKRIIETIRNLERDIQQNNSVPVDSEREIDVRLLLKQHDAWVTHLVDVKLAIQEATRPVMRLVLELAESKSAINFWKDVVTTNGTFKDRYGSTLGDVKVKADFRKTEVDTKTKELQDKIDKLQSKIDDHNASVLINITAPQLP